MSQHKLTNLLVGITHLKVVRHRPFGSYVYKENTKAKIIFFIFDNNGVDLSNPYTYFNI